MSTNDLPTGTFDRDGADRPTGSVAGSGAELTVEQALLLDDACNAFEAKWRGGGRPDIAAAVLGLPEAVRPVALKELVALDVFYRRKAGETPTTGDYADRFLDLDPNWLAGVVSGIESPSVSETIAPAPPPRAVEGIGTVIAGKYALVEVIGEGGMGSVYLARQSEPVKRDVALKLIKGGLDSKMVLARFDAERQALALMDHPNIARVFDGGTTATGRPFFVMELVKGVPITQFCDQKRLPISARLNLFVQVCQAVQHAHQKGIIHRDLKPGNILVAEVDGKPTPKVIDFGVAKATEKRLTDLSYADTGAIVGTPAYMSPEQAEPSSADIDTRTDVYALGVILYELLTGSPPLDARQFRRGAVLEMLRMVREVEPLRASTKLSTADDLPTIAANRDIEPARLAKLLRGELDWVVMKALEKDRTRRYDTANGLARDLQRYLADEVVEARPPSRGYRIRKFVRRNKGQVLAAALILLTLVGGIVGTSLALVVARREAERADRQADRATKAADRADREAADARSAEARARDSEGRAKDSARLAKWNERLAKDANHAIKLGLAQRAPDLKDWVLVRELLDETHADYGQTFENRFVRALWLRGTVPVQSFTGHANFVTGAALSPDGRHVATSSWDRTARVWSAETGNHVRALTGHTNFVTSVAYSPDGKRIVTGSWDRTARSWDADTGAERLVLNGHAHYVLGAAYSADGKRIVTASYDGTARVWDAETGKELLALIGHAGPVWGAAFSPDGTHVVTAGDSAARIWDAQSGKELLALNGYPEPITTAAFSPDGARVVTAGHDRTARVWDAGSGRAVLALKGHGSGVASVAYSPDGTRIVTAGHDSTVRVWEADTGVEKLNLNRHTSTVASASFSRDGTRLVTASWDQTARVWSTESITEKHVLLGHTTAITCAAYSPDGTRIATGAAADDKLGEVKVWDAATGTLMFTLKKFSEPLRDVEYSPDGAS